MRPRPALAAALLLSFRSLLSLLVLLALTRSGPAGAQDLLFPEWEYQTSEEESHIKNGAGKGAEATYSFINDTVSDTWTMTKSPFSWDFKDWMVAGAVAGTTVGLIYSVDMQVASAVRGNQGFEKYGESIRWLGTGPGLVVLTGSFFAVGTVFDGPREIETARLLLEASAAGLLFTSAGKLVLGRSRPRANRGPTDFNPFSGATSMPSGETTSAFIMAGVVTSQYPSWPVQVTAYSLATAVGLGRIALDAHWTSDVFISAALGIAVSKTVVHLNRKRAEKRRRYEKLTGKKKKPDRTRHFIQVSPRAFRWTYIF